jgi:ribonuclease HII
MVLPDLLQEESLWEKGITRIVGIDEVGRGSWAGPLVAAGVILPSDFKIPKYLADSKLLTSQKRRELDKILRKEVSAFKIAEVSHRVINKIGIGKATQIAFRKIVNSLSPRPQYCLVDAFHIRYLAKAKQKAIKHGDMTCASIAAASIIAKVYRDNLMEEMSQKFPNYGFEKHKGYGTREHQLAIKTYGFSDFHRTSFNFNFLEK